MEEQAAAPENLGATAERRTSPGLPELTISRMTVRPLASQPGLEDSPSMSPDGLWISCLYRARAVDRPQSQVHSIKGGVPVVIETGGLVVQGPASWSPDSSELALSALEGSRDHAVYRVRRTGGAPRQIVKCRPRADSGCELDWSPDGTTLAVAEPSMWKRAAFGTSR
jgi:Tol biopolymer transport system component